MPIHNDERARRTSERERERSYEEQLRCNVSTTSTLRWLSLGAGGAALARHESARRPAMLALGALPSRTCALTVALQSDAQSARMSARHPALCQSRPITGTTARTTVTSRADTLLKPPGELHRVTEAAWSQVHDCNAAKSLEIDRWAGAWRESETATTTSYDRNVRTGCQRHLALSLARPPCSFARRATTTSYDRNASAASTLSSLSHGAGGAVLARHGSARRRASPSRSSALTSAFKQARLAYQQDPSMVRRQR